MEIKSIIDQYPVLTLLLAWIVISVFASRLSGWYALAKIYRLSSPFNGKLFRFRTLWMRFATHYGNCITTGVNSQGLHLSILFILRIGHDPLFMPWSEITTSEITSGFSKRIKLQFKRMPSVPIIIDRRLADDLSRESYGAWVIK